MTSTYPRLHSTGALFASGLAAALLLLGPGAAAAQTDTSGGPAPVDPCQLVTASEASALAGANFDTGTYSDNGSTCIYGAQTVNVFMITAAQATDADTAQADWAQDEAKVQSVSGSSVPAGITVNFNVNDVNDLAGADRAATGQMSLAGQGHAISGSAFYLLKGATFVGFSDLQVGTGAPSSDAMESQAATVLSRLP